MRNAHIEYKLLKYIKMIYIVMYGIDKNALSDLKYPRPAGPNGHVFEIPAARSAERPCVKT